MCEARAEQADRTATGGGSQAAVGLGSNIDMCAMRAKRMRLQAPLCGGPAKGMEITVDDNAERSRSLGRFAADQTADQQTPCVVATQKRWPSNVPAWIKSICRQVSPLLMKPSWPSVSRQTRMRAGQSLHPTDCTIAQPTSHRTHRVRLLSVILIGS